MDIMSQPKLHITHGFKKIAFQTVIFSMTYLSHASMHFTKEGWSIIKSDVRSDEPPGLGWEHNNNAGLVDFFFLICYSIGLFISGILGDNYPIRIIVPIGYMIVASMIVMISFGGTWGITSVYYYIVFFSISGLCQSISLASFVAVMGNWFAKDSRGLIFGIWCTCQNMGNIGGNLIANLLRSQFNMTWMWNFRTIGIIVAIIAILDFFLLVDHPSKKGIVVELPDDEEQKEIAKRSESLNQIRKAINLSKRKETHKQENYTRSIRGC
jgi:sugar phosphate permease